MSSSSTSAELPRVTEAPAVGGAGPRGHDASSIAPAEIGEPDPLGIEPRPCMLCGMTIDRHEMIDRGEGLEFLCADLSPDEMTIDELERRDVLRLREEIAAGLASMAAMPRPAPLPPPPYRPAASTVAAFRFVVAAAGDVERIRRWLADRPKDAPFLLAMLEGNTPC